MLIRDCLHTECDGCNFSCQVNQKNYDATKTPQIRWFTPLQDRNYLAKRSVRFRHCRSIWPILDELRTMGFHIAIDNFGTDLSSYSALHKLPVNLLKIDQSFVRTLDEEESILEIVSSITKLAKQIGIQTVAEGIETSSSVAAMQSTDCTFGQGYYYSRPLSVEDAEAILVENNNRILSNRAA